jgi:hypothetical protein
MELLAQSEPKEIHGPGRDGGASNPSLIYMEIVRHVEAAPPEADWDGVFEMKEK